MNPPRRTATAAGATAPAGTSAEGSVGLMEEELLAHKQRASASSQARAAAEAELAALEGELAHILALAAAKREEVETKQEEVRAVAEATEAQQAKVEDCAAKLEEVKAQQEAARTQAEAEKIRLQKEQDDSAAAETAAAEAAAAAAELEGARTSTALDSALQAVPIRESATEHTPGSDDKLCTEGTLRHLAEHGCAVERRPGRGRCVIAARPLPAGAVVMQTAANAAVLLPHFLERRCGCCFTKPGPAHKLLRCARCSQVAYCSKGCQKLDWASHKRECAVIGFLRQNDVRAHRLMDEGLVFRAWMPHGHGRGIQARYIWAEGEEHACIDYTLRRTIRFDVPFLYRPYR